MKMMRTCRLLAQTTLRNILGTKNLHEILSDRESISGSMQVIIKCHARTDAHLQAWAHPASKHPYLHALTCNCTDADLHAWTHRHMKTHMYVWDKIQGKLFQAALDEATEPWGIKVERVEM